MKKLFIIPAAALLMVACGEDKKEPETELEATEQQAQEAAEEGVFTPLGFNDGIMANITLLDVKMLELEDMDYADTTEEAIIATADASIAEADKVIEALGKFDIIGTKGQDFMDVAMGFSKAFRDVAQGYKDLADVFATPDDEWTDEHWDRYDTFSMEAEEVFAQFDSDFIDMQLEYFDLNGLTAGETVDVEAIYDEQKEHDAAN